MKKILITILFVTICATTSFAQGLISDTLEQADQEIAKAGEQFPKGTWIDHNWDAAWEFGVNNTIILKDANTGKVIYNFTKNTRSNFKVNITDKGLEISFYCADTKRAYKFTKPLTLSTNITLEIDADFLNNHYKVDMKMKN